MMNNEQNVIVIQNPEIGIRVEHNFLLCEIVNWREKRKEFFYLGVIPVGYKVFGVLAKNLIDSKKNKKNG